MMKVTGRAIEMTTESKRGIERHIIQTLGKRNLLCQTKGILAGCSTEGLSCNIVAEMIAQ